ncbi:MAG: PQQ-binding-like beta-propeller repeat protein [Myxococcota bacterium]
MTACAGPVWEAPVPLAVGPGALCAVGARALTQHGEGVWALDLATGARRQVASIRGAAWFAPDCERFAVVARRPRGVEAAVYDAAGQRRQTVLLDWDEGWSASGAWALDGDDLLHVSSDGAQRFSLASGRARWGWRRSDLRLGAFGSVAPLVAVPCDHQAAQRPPADRGVCVVDRRSGRLVEHADTPVARLATSADTVFTLAPDAVAAYDARTWARHWRVPLPRASGAPEPVGVGAAVLVDGGFVVAGRGTALLVLDARDGRVLHRLTKRDTSAPSLAGHTVAWTEPSGAVRMLDLSTGAEHAVASMRWCRASLWADPWPCAEWTDLRVVPPYVVLGDDRRSGAWRP